MIKAPYPSNEALRLKTLREYGILDTQQEAHFDEITKTAAQICNCRISLISLVDKDREWFKSKHGLEVAEVPRDISFCGHAIMEDELFIVEDASQDKRFCDNPLVLEDPTIRFYAGAPLIAPNGQRIGTLCIIDSEAKVLSPEQKSLLTTLSKQIINYLELKVTIEERNSSLRFLKSIQDNAAHAFISTDKSGIITSFNKKAEETLGYSSEELVGKHTPAIFHDLNQVVDRSVEFSKKLGQHIEPGFDTFICHTRLGFKNYFDWTYIHKNGTSFQVGLSITALEDESGEAIGYLGIAQDLTEHIIIEKELSKTNRYLDLALEGAGLGIWDWDLKSDFVNYDERWGSMLGYRHDEIEMGLATWKDNVHPEDLEGCLRDIDDYLNGRTDRYENIHRMKHKNGHWVHILAMGRFSEWNDTTGEPIRFTGTVLDITESKRAQDERLNELVEILSSTPSCLKIITKEGQLLDMNLQGLNLIEADNLESVYKANVYDIVEESHRKKFVEFNEKICSGEKGSLTFEIIGLKGTKRWMETYAAPYKLSSGEMAHIAITNDVTEKIIAQNEYASQKLIAQHQSKLASIGELAAGVGHEINNPLAIVKGYLKVIEKLTKSKQMISYEELRPHIEQIDLATDRIGRIVRGLRTFSRSDSTEVSEFSPSEALEESFNMVREIYQQEGIEIEYSNNLSNSNFMIKGNRGKFQQILMNLISNAKDASASRAGKLIELTLKDSDNCIEVSVKDYGHGISDDAKDKIFDPFYTTKDVNKGTGIGLSLVYNFVKEMNGTIKLESKESEGSLFVAQFPALIQKHIQSVVKDEVRELPQYRASAILAEDEEVIRVLLSGLLEEMGIKITPAENGQIAYDLYLKHPEMYDLIISDMKMPVMDGLTLLKSIRSDLNLVQPKFIFVTGGINMNFEDNESYLNKLIDGYFYKPFDENKILQVLSSCLEDIKKKVA